MAWFSSRSTCWPTPTDGRKKQSWRCPRVGVRDMLRAFNRSGYPGTGEGKGASAAVKGVPAYFSKLIGAAPKGLPVLRAPRQVLTSPPESVSSETEFTAQTRPVGAQPLVPHQKGKSPELDTSAPLPLRSTPLHAPVEVVPVSDDSRPVLSPAVSAAREPGSFDAPAAAVSQPNFFAPESSPELEPSRVSALDAILDRSSSRYLHESGRQVPAAEPESER